jgi:hypothetical protein
MTGGCVLYVGALLKFFCSTPQTAMIPETLLSAKRGFSVDLFFIDRLAGDVWRRTQDGQEE